VGGAVVVDVGGAVVVDVGGAVVRATVVGVTVVGVTVVGVTVVGVVVETVVLGVCRLLDLALAVAPPTSVAMTTSRPATRKLRMGSPSVESTRRYSWRGVRNEHRVSS
jgi:CBS domain containing-hemolysin-like protein